ncbi:MAG: 2-C-methyl-D-erythritol 4-phosphate cytidylyltransferase, partial [Coriobacteriales bacterium]|nr:2-C-methyl-D-erythritol 4-phosphate cytidylyltransferase [Coriobacteriales bacterium]
TLEAFQKHDDIDSIVVVCLEGWEDKLLDYAKQYNITKLEYLAPGGETGQQSIKNGLLKIKEHYSENCTVLIHDGNRGLVSSEIISGAIECYKQHGGAITAIPCQEAAFLTKDKLSSNKEIPRSEIVRTQTPHVFKLEKLLWAHEQATIKGISNTAATCSLLTQLGEEIYFSPGSEKNIKITTPEDIEIFKALLKQQK